MTEIKGTSFHGICQDVVVLLVTSRTIVYALMHFTEIKQPTPARSTMLKKIEKTFIPILYFAVTLIQVLYPVMSYV